MSNSFIIDDAIADNLELISDKWSLLVLRDAFLGRTRFDEFLASSGVSRSLLTRRLTALLAGGLLKKRALVEGKARQHYLLTEKGTALFDAALLAWTWEQEWQLNKSKQTYPLTHNSCSHVFRPHLRCAHCEKSFTVDDLAWFGGHRSDVQQQFTKLDSRYAQRKIRSRSFSGEDTSLSKISDIIGDRWTVLIIIASLFGVKTYDAFAEQLSIATNILSSRLKALTRSGILSRQAYQSNPPRFEYLLSDSGKALSGLVLLLRQWAIEQIPSDQPQYQELLKHAPCGNALKLAVACSRCEEPAQPHEIRLASK